MLWHGRRIQVHIFVPGVRKIINDFFSSKRYCINMLFLSGIGEDSYALVWDIMAKQRVLYDPILSYHAEAEINQLSWSNVSSDWIAIAQGNTVQALKV